MCYAETGERNAFEMKRIERKIKSEKETRELKEKMGK